MTNPDFVLIDTCIGAPFFNRPQSVEKQAVDALVDEDRAALFRHAIPQKQPGNRRGGDAAELGDLSDRSPFRSVSEVKRYHP
jgi:hypothetical protein